MDPFFWQSVLVGFLAQLVDGALGMAYGLVSTSFLMAMGVPPAAASAAVHTAEIFQYKQFGGGSNGVELFYFFCVVSKDDLRNIFDVRIK